MIVTSFALRSPLRPFRGNFSVTCTFFSFIRTSSALYLRNQGCAAVASAHLRLHPLTSVHIDLHTPTSADLPLHLTTPTHLHIYITSVHPHCHSFTSALSFFLSFFLLSFFLHIFSLASVHLHLRMLTCTDLPLHLHTSAHLYRTCTSTLSLLHVHPLFLSFYISFLFIF